MYNYEILPSLQKIVQKLSKKDKVLYEQVLKKIQEVIHSSEVEHYKNLRYDLSNKKRVHVGHFVLVFRFIAAENKVIFVDCLNWVSNPAACCGIFTQFEA